ncbi:hypothetical protein ACTXT7_010676 [Hymenolepis weldensis]
MNESVFAIDYASWNNSTLLPSLCSQILKYFAIQTVPRSAITGFLQLERTLNKAGIRRPQNALCLERGGSHGLSLLPVRKYTTFDILTLNVEEILIGSAKVAIQLVDSAIFGYQSIFYLMDW